LASYDYQWGFVGGAMNISWLAQNLTNATFSLLRLERTVERRVQDIHPINRNCLKPSNKAVKKPIFRSIKSHQEIIAKFHTPQ
jgi:hypothetical protein